MDINNVLQSILVSNTQTLTESEFSELLESEKFDYIKTISDQIIDGIYEKLPKIDLGIIDRTRGDISKLPSIEDNTIQNTIKKLKTLGNDNKDILQYTNIIDIALGNIFKYSQTFKDAYRNNKTVLIAKYQSIIISIIVSLEYIISTVISAESGKIKDKYHLSNIKPLRALDDFNLFVKSGDFNKAIKDSQIFRESFNENEDYFDRMSRRSVSEGIKTIIEEFSENSFLNEDAFDSDDTLSQILKSFKNISQSLKGNSGNLIQALYKSAGVLALLFSIRDSVYSISRLKDKYPEITQRLKNFANFSVSPSEQPANKDIVQRDYDKTKLNIEVADEIADREISAENRELVQIKNSPTFMAPINDPLPMDSTIDF